GRVLDAVAALDEGHAEAHRRKEREKARLLAAQVLRGVRLQVVRVLELRERLAKIQLDGLQLLDRVERKSQSQEFPRDAVDRLPRVRDPFDFAVLAHDAEFE